MGRRVLRQILICAADVFECPGPGSAVISHAPVFHIGGGASFRGKSGTKMTCVFKVVFCSPVSTVDVNSQGMRDLSRPIARRKTHVNELVSIGTIAEPSVDGRRVAGEEIVGHDKVILALAARLFIA